MPCFFILFNAQYRITTHTKRRKYSFLLLYATGLISLNANHQLQYPNGKSEVIEKVLTELSFTSRQLDRISALAKEELSKGLKDKKVFIGFEDAKVEGTEIKD
jgi:hypothetical protein